jgi:methionyl-tRNA formyltransferase
LRIAILSNTLPAALPIYDKLAGTGHGDVFVVLSPPSRDSASRDLFRHLARWAIKKRRWQSLRLVIGRRVILLTETLNHPKSVLRLKKLDPDVGIHKSGTIYRQVTIDCFRLGILNAHIGTLPEYRGRSVMEWSLLQGDRPGISVFFIDTGIDTGRRIVFSETVDISHCRSVSEAKDYLFNLDAQFYSRALELIESGTFQSEVNEGSGRRYYVMSKLFHDVADKCVQIGNRQPGIGNN